MTYSINTPEMTALVRWLRDERLRAGLSMRELAGLLSKPHSFVQKVESGERRLDVVEFVWYCGALGQDPAVGVEIVRQASGRKGMPAVFSRP